MNFTAFTKSWNFDSSVHWNHWTHALSGRIYYAKWYTKNCWSSLERKQRESTQPAFSTFEDDQGQPIQHRSTFTSKKPPAKISSFPNFPPIFFKLARKPFKIAKKNTLFLHFQKKSSLITSQFYQENQWERKETRHGLYWQQSYTRPNLGIFYLTQELFFWDVSEKFCKAGRCWSLTALPLIERATAELTVSHLFSAAENFRKIPPIQIMTLQIL